MLRLLESIISQLACMEGEKKKADPGSSLWQSFRGSVVRLLIVNVWLTEQLPAWRDLCKRPRGIPKATSMGLYPAFLSAAGSLAPHCLWLFMWIETDSCTGQRSVCALCKSHLLFAPLLHPHCVETVVVGLHASIADI